MICPRTETSKIIKTFLSTSRLRDLIFKLRTLMLSRKKETLLMIQKTLFLKSPRPLATTYNVQVSVHSSDWLGRHYSESKYYENDGGDIILGSSLSGWRAVNCPENI